MANLSLKHIYKVYPNGTKAVNDFNMQIENEEFIVFVGPSGCGKSTMLRMIAGLEEISAGELRIDDKVVNDMEPKDRDIAMVFQNYALYPHMTIFENMAFGLQCTKMQDVKKDEAGNPILDDKGNPVKVMRSYTKEEINKRVTEAAEILGITDYLKRKPKEMSGGQRQRVALGRAIVRDPKVMLLDEPLSNLDAKLRTQMRSEIVKLHKKLATTFIYVTHDQVEAMTMGTRIVVMKLGFIQQIDTPKNLYLYPANKFVAGFIGTPQMNFFDGTLKKVGDNVHIAFNNSKAEIDVPFEMLLKTPPKYLDGTIPVSIGLRAEDVSLDPEVISKSKAVIKMRISHTEELGTETLVYGDINLDYDGIAETDTRIIVKAAGFKDFKFGEVVDVALNLDAVHIFDTETEESILPRIPKNNFVNCTVKNSQLTFNGNKVELPQAMHCDDGDYSMLLPPDAITRGGDIKAEIVDSENINGQILTTLLVGGKKLFTLSDVGSEKTINIDLDFKKVTLLKGMEEEIKPLPLVNAIDGTLTMKKVVKEVEENGKVKKKKSVEYFVKVNDMEFTAPQDVTTKMFGSFTGRKVFNSVFSYEFSPYDLSISDDGITAEVVEILNYGKESFAKCVANGTTLFVRIEKPVSGNVHIALNLNNVSVVEKERDIRIA